MRCAILVFCAGIMSAAIVIDVAAALVFCIGSIFIVAALLVLAGACDCHRLLRPVLFYAICFLLGSAWHLQWANARLHERLPRSLEGVTLRVEGVVAGLPERSLVAQQFHFQILRSPSGFHPRRVVLNYYGDAQIAPGQIWQFSVRLNRPHGFANPGGFDYEGWLFQQGVAARGYVRQTADNALLAAGCGEANCSMPVLIHSLRYSLRARLKRLSTDLPYAGLLIALVLGDRSAISQSDWNLFSATGSNHLFVISGLHIGMVSGFFYLLSLLLGRVLGIGRVVPTQKFAAAGALVSAFSYALLAGFTLPTQRAFIMIAVLICGAFWNTRYLISFRLLLALLLVLMINPLAIIGAGFWLSFVAVAALLAFAEDRADREPPDLFEPSLLNRLRTLSRSSVRPQLIVPVALALPLIFFTGQFSLLSPLVNVVAIPVVGFLIVPLCFIAVLASFIQEVAAEALLGAAHGCIVLLMGFMETLARWGGDSLQLQLSPPSVAQSLAMCFAAMLLLLPRGVCRRSLIIPLLLPLLPLPKSLVAAVDVEDSLRVHIIDVGQGLAVAVQTAGHALLYDSGANLSPDFNMGSAVVAPALRALGIDELDAVVISHGDNDHAGGLSGLRQHMKIRRLIANDRGIDPNGEAVLCGGVDDWNWDGVEFRFLGTGLDFVEENNRSCVLQIRFADHGILLPGDIERGAEAGLVLRYGDQLASTVILAPHHGSLSSSSYGLLKRVRPDYVVFSAGYHNSFGHPHETVRARYQEFSSRQLTTSEAGMISFDFGGDETQAGTGIGLQQYREQNFRYWR